MHTRTHARTHTHTETSNYTRIQQMECPVDQTILQGLTVYYPHLVVATEDNKTS